MARSPKVFHYRASAPSSWAACLIRVYRSPGFSFFCLVVGFFGIAFGSMAVLRSSKSVGGCREFVLRFVSVVDLERGGGGNLVDVGGQSERHKVMAFVGIQTGFGSAERRRSLRKTWMPSDRDGLRRLEESTGLALRFIIGRTSNSLKMSALRKEVEEYDDFLLLDIEEQYSNLPYKTLAFFKVAFRLFDCDFYVKADDDIYLRPDRLSLLLAKDRSHSQTYIGCMKKGPVFTNPNLKWYEPLSHLLGSEYFLHAYGPIYALSAQVVSKLVVLSNDSFRMFSNEDVTIGAWMLAMNVNYENNKELCSLECTSSSIAVWDLPKCSGLCNPEEKLVALHQKEICSNSPTSSHD